ncbi:MAG: hypothetical protein QOG50_1243 [Actinomycetota bacterium]|nr:hypothetical protein [Actinomycetota bacterium]
MSARLGEDAADNVRRTHFAVLERAAATHHGDVVKNLGDGLMVAYRSAADGAAGAVAMQQAIDRHNRNSTDEPLGVRIGVALGDATCEDGDYFGTPVVEAARLCAQAEGGQILVTGVVQALTGRRGDHTFRSVGMLELKGLPEPIAASELLWDPARGAGLPLPTALSVHEQLPFVGREPAQAVLFSAWERAESGDRRTVLVSGEPGIGKTRLSEEFARELHARHATVLYGRCDEDLGVPYQPFVEALRHYVDHSPDRDLVARLGRHAGELGRLLPDLEERVPDLAPPFAASPEAERYRLFDAVADWLTTASEDAPVLFVVDDLHWATKATLLLLRHVMRATEPARVLVLGTYRDTEVDRTPELTELLAALRRESGIERIALAGLRESDVGLLVDTTASQQSSPRNALAKSVTEATDGNPFFVGEVVRDLGRLQSGASGQLDVPEGVRDVVRRRVAALPAATNQLLSWAAVIGTQFDARVLERVCDLEEAALLEALETALGARLIDSAGGERYRFAHALVRAALHEEMSASRRTRYHRDVAEALERLHDDRAEEHLAELAYHFTEAADRGTADKAVEYARRAGEHADTALAFEEAAIHYRRGLRALELTERDGPRRFALLSSLGHTSWRVADSSGAKEAFAEARMVARSMSDPVRLAEATLGFAGGAYALWWASYGEVDTQLVGWLEEALEALPRDDHDLGVRLSAVLARQLYSAEESLTRRLSLSGSAVAMARRLGDQRTLAFALLARHQAVWTRDNTEERLTLAGEVAQLAELLADDELAFQVRYFRVADLLEVGDIDAAEAEREILHRLEVEFRQPFYHFLSEQLAIAHKIYVGDLAEAESRSEAAYELGQRAHHPEALGVLLLELGAIRGIQGRGAELAEGLQDYVDQFPEMASVRTGLAAMYAAEGKLDQARAEFAHFAADRFATVPDDFQWMASMTALVDTCVAIGDAEGAQRLYELLLSYAGRNVMTGYGMTCEPSVDRYLGLLATMLERWDDAEMHFAAAAERARRMGARPHLAWTQFDWASMLVHRGREADRGRALDLAENALAAAEQLGMGLFTERAATLRDDCLSAASRPKTLDPD